MPVFDEVVLSTQLMKNVIDVDANAGTLDILYLRHPLAGVRYLS